MVIDTLVCTTTLAIACLQVAVKGRKSHDNLRNMLYNNAFGSDAFNPPELHNVDFHGDRGYFSEKSFLDILLATGCLLTCTCPRGVWLPFAFGKFDPKEGDSRLVVPEEGMMTCEVREKVFKSEGRELTLAIVAFRTGTGKVVLVASSHHRRLTMDFVAVNDTTAKMWRLDRNGFKKMAFSLDCSIFEGTERALTHNTYHDLFSEIPIDVGTAYQ